MAGASDWIMIHSKDSVVITLRDFTVGESLVVHDELIVVSEAVPAGHKIAVQQLEEGQDIMKYGYSIGCAIRSIRPGEWVHTHNAKTKLSDELEYRYTPYKSDQGGADSTTGAPTAQRTFQGYVRVNGDVGIRNEIWVLTTVGCINKTAEALVKRAQRELNLEGIDGICHYPHPYGCSQLGGDLNYTQRILRNLALHPNAAGVLVLGLGCENNYMKLFTSSFDTPLDEDRMKFVVVQEVIDEMEEGMDKLRELVKMAKEYQREPVPLSKLKIGMKCGGSDGFSGITANPLLGALSDELVRSGGTAILTEVPEMFGAETILMDRAKEESVFKKIVQLINGFKQYYKRHNQVIYENPSPGNKEGGITTLEEKSLGCVQKGGHSPVADVINYGERVTEPGLNLVEGPGNDLVSVTALIAAGAQIVCFTTGRGTPFGGPVPTVKVSTNTALAKRKPGWIDFDAGRLLQGQTMNRLTEELLDYIVDIASGMKQTNNERNEHKEIAIFKDGVTL